MTKMTWIFYVENAFDPISEVQNIENRVFEITPFANGNFPNVDYNCLWAKNVVSINFTVLRFGIRKSDESGDNFIHFKSDHEIE